MAWFWVVEAQLDPVNPATWVAISGYVQSISLNRGRSDDLEQPETSTLTVLLENDDGRFTPENTLGAYHPRITLNRGVRARVDVNGTVTTRFTGHSIAWHPVWDAAVPGRVQLVANDALERLTQVEVDEYAAAAVIRRMTPAGYWPLNQSDQLADLSDAAVTATALGTYRTGADWIYYSSLDLRGLAEYWGGSFQVGNAAEAVGAAYAPDHARYGLPNQAFSVHFRIWAEQKSGESGTALDANLLGIGDENPGATAVGNRFLNARWALYTDTAGVIQFARGNGDGTQTTWSTGRTLNLLVGRSYIFVVTPSRFRVWENGTLVVDDATVDATPRLRPAAGYVWMGAFAGGSGNAEYAANGLFGRMSDVAVWARDISTDPLFEHLRHSWRGWFVDATETAGTRIGRWLDIAGWPTADRDLDVGTTRLHPHHETGTVVDAIQKAAATDAGVLYVDAAGRVAFEGRRDRWQNRRTIAATYGDGPGETPHPSVEYAYDRVALRNDVEVSSPVHAARREDTASQSSFGRRDLSFSVDAYAEAATPGSPLLDRANLELQARKDMRLRITGLGQAEIDSDARATAALALQLGDLIRVVRRPSGSDVIDRRMRVQQTTDQVGAGGYMWTVNVATTDAEVDAAIEPLGTFTVGQSRLSY